MSLNQLSISETLFNEGLTSRFIRLGVVNAVDSLSNGEGSTDAEL